MKFASSILTLGAGIVIGITFVLSCGDDSPRKADAADAGACTCPAAESPIAGRLMYVVKPFTVPANTMGQSMDAACPMGGIAISGGCGAVEGQSPNLVLEQSYPAGEGAGGEGWICYWRNPSNADIPVRAIVRCLMPAK